MFWIKDYKKINFKLYHILFQMTMAKYGNNGPGELHNNSVGFEMDLESSPY